MVEWKGLALQFIPALLGSILVVTTLSSLYLGINQPDINVIFLTMYFH
jgi:hypothetical protein